MYSANYVYHHDKQDLYGFLTYDNSSNTPRPTVLVIHDWSGRNDFACQKALSLAKLGYVGFAVDMFGEAQIGITDDEKNSLIQDLLSRPLKLRARLQAAYNAVQSIPQVDKTQIATIGFCFGGLCALELARMGINIKGVVSFHGLLKSLDTKCEKILAKLLVLHGYEDPMVKSHDLELFCKQMTEKKVDWQVHMYGLVQHAFTNPEAHNIDAGLMYNQVAAQRSWLTMTNFLEELFSPT